MPLDPTKEKYLAFNWNVLEIDGHDIRQILSALNKAKRFKGKPTMIIANNIPGKGVSFMENNYQWHGKPPTPEQAGTALAELEHEREMLLEAKG
jgi:transketolase